MRSCGSDHAGVGGGDTEDIGLGGHGILLLDDWSIGIIGSTFIGI